MTNSSSTTPAWVPVLVAIVGAIAVLAAAALTSWQSSRREARNLAALKAQQDAALDHELTRERERFAHDRAMRVFDLKRRAYEDLTVAADLTLTDLARRRAAGEPIGPFSKEFEPVVSRMSVAGLYGDREVLLAARKVRDAAEVYVAAESESLPVATYVVGERLNELSDAVRAALDLPPLGRGMPTAMPNS